MNPWLPKSVLLLRDYNLRKFTSDVIAGITVGLVALPLAMAFAISSGLEPQAGIYCAVVTGFIISALGGSKCQIGGPTGAFVVVVAGIVAKYGVGGLFICTMMAGVILVVLGVTKSGTAVKFIPRPVVVGFTNGIAVLIASTQIKDFFGLDILYVPGEFLARAKALVAAFPTWHLGATIVAGLALLTILFFTRYVPRIPGSIVALLGGTALVTALKPRGDRRLAVRRRAQRPAAPSYSALRAAADPDTALSGTDRGHARRHRVPAFGGSFRPHERRYAQPQCGAGGARCGQHRLAAVRRAAGHRRHRPDRDPLRSVVRPTRQRSWDGH